MIPMADTICGASVRHGVKERFCRAQLCQT